MKRTLIALTLGVALIGTACVASPAMADENPTAQLTAATERNDGIAVLTFSANGGEGYFDDVIFLGSEVVAFPGPDRSNASAPGIPFTKEGYTFNGWNTKADGTGTPFAPGDTIDVQQAFALSDIGNVIVYAQWKSIDAPAEYTVSFDSNGATGQVASLTTVDGKLPTPSAAWRESWDSLSRPGYAFWGWDTQPDGNGLGGGGNDGLLNIDDIMAFPITSDTTLYAHWEKLYTLTFDANYGGYWHSEDIVGRYNPFSFHALTRDGYTFKGWTESRDGSGRLYKAGDAGWFLTADTTFYAQWEKVADKPATDDPDTGKAEPPAKEPTINPLPFEQLNESNSGDIGLASLPVAGSIVRIYLNSLAQDVKDRVDAGEQVRMYAFIYSTPQALTDENGNAYSVVLKDGTGYYINALIPAGYSGTNTIAVYDENGTLQGWRTTTVSDASAKKPNTLATTGSSALPLSLATIVMMVVGSGMGILRKFQN